VRGSTWDARHLNGGGNVVRDLRADIAAEGGALATHEALRHLATHQVAQARMFMKALGRMNKLDDPMFGDLKPDDTVAVQFNPTTGPEAEQRADVPCARPGAGGAAGRRDGRQVAGPAFAAAAMAQTPPGAPCGRVRSALPPVRMVGCAAGAA
jgi:hypothetical protein